MGAVDLEEQVMGVYLLDFPVDGLDSSSGLRKLASSKSLRGRPLPMVNFARCISIALWMLLSGYSRSLLAAVG